MSAGPLSWSTEHAGALGLAALGTAAALALTVVVAPWLVARLPVDHFARPGPAPGPRGALGLAVRVARNALALAVLALGLAMLVLPGPGLVTIVVGLSLAEFPGKRAAVARLAGSPRVFASLNWLRRRRGRPPFVHPGDADADGTGRAAPRERGH